MKYCLKCGASNADSSKFCMECGASLAADSSAKNKNTDFTYEEVNDSASTSSDCNEDTSYTYGEPVTETSIVKTTYSESSSADEDKYKYTYNADTHTHTTYNSVNPGIIPRNIVAAVLLSFVTCGIYQIYWFVKMTDEVNILASEPDAPSGIMAFLFTFITCGIYGFFWAYKMGERCDRIKGSVGGSSAILYLILAILGLGIVNYCLIQDTINKAVA